MSDVTDAMTAPIMAVAIRLSQQAFIEDNAHNISPWRFTPMAYMTRNQQLLAREFNRVSALTKEARP